MRAMKDASSTLLRKQQVEQQIMPDKRNSLFSGIIIYDHNILWLQWSIWHVTTKAIEWIKPGWKAIGNF